MILCGCMIFCNGIDLFFRKYFYVECNRVFVVYLCVWYVLYWVLEFDFLGFVFNNGDVSGFSLGF